MIAFARLAVIGLIAMTVMYFVLSIYSRSVRREKLEKEWDAEHGAGGDVPPVSGGGAFRLGGEAVLVETDAEIAVG